MIAYLINKDKRTFFTMNMIAVVVFAVLYVIQDYIVCDFPELAKSLKFIRKDYDASNDTPNSFLYYIWFSLITQTTVGYAGIVNTKTNEVYHFENDEYRISKLINLIQLMSVFYIGAIFL